MIDGKTVKCPLCGKPYKFFSFLARDQSACPKCVKEAESNMNYKDNAD